MNPWQQLLHRLESPIYGNSWQQWGLALLVAVLLFLLLKVVHALLVSRLRPIAERFSAQTGPVVVEAIASIRTWLLLVVALFVASQLLALPPKATTFVNALTIVVCLLQVALTGNAILRRLVADYSQKNLQTDAASVTTVMTLGFLGRLTLWTVVVLLALQNIGVDVTALVAGLGIGGIAVALAAQNVLGDLFASLSIMLDKPFVLGDFIIVGEQMGTVEKIGIKSTHLRSLSGEQLIISNADLLKSRIRNFKRMKERRMTFNLSLAYHTPPEKVAGISPMLREIVEAQDPVRFDRAHLKTLGVSALEFEVVYFVLSPDNTLAMDVQQRINLQILERFAAAGIEFAYPPKLMVVQPGGGGSPAP
jgi:small-conductance mechanosensitive channel